MMELSTETVEALRLFMDAVRASTEPRSGEHIHARVLQSALEADLARAKEVTARVQAVASANAKREQFEAREVVDDEGDEALVCAERDRLARQVAEQERTIRALEVDEGQWAGERTKLRERAEKGEARIADLEADAADVRILFGREADYPIVVLANGLKCRVANLETQLGAAEVRANEAEGKAVGCFRLDPELVRKGAADYLRHFQHMMTWHPNGEGTPRVPLLAILASAIEHGPEGEGVFVTRERLREVRGKHGFADWEPKDKDEKPESEEGDQ